MMVPLYIQRDELVKENTRLILEWLALADDCERREIVESMVRRFSLPQLKESNLHVAREIARIKSSGRSAGLCIFL